ncbi:MAG: hypothetical protein JWR80_2337 [Bradyrhizobium sp.]|nr:hypothetical protein [Bradyrhizobium sp.]
MIAFTFSRCWGLAPAFVAALLAANLLSGPARAQTPAQTDIAGVTIHNGPSEATQAWAKAMESGDLAAMARMHGPHTVSYDPDSEVTRGDTAINAGYAKLFETYRARVEFRNAQWVRSGAVLSSWGEFTLTLTPHAGGEPRRRSGQFTDVAVWTGKDWQYVVDHASVPTR